MLQRLYANLSVSRIILVIWPIQTIGFS